MRKARLPVRKGKPEPASFVAELDAESKEILRIISSIATAESDPSTLIDSLQLLFAARAAVDEEVVFPHAGERLTRREHREALERAQLRTRVVDTLLARAASIESAPARRAWCALIAAEASALFADEKKLRVAFRPTDLRVLRRDAATVRADVAAMFSR